MSDSRTRVWDGGGGLNLSHRGRALYPEKDPLDSIRRKAAVLPLDDETLYLVPSPCLGYGLDLLLDRLPPRSLLVCVEHDPDLYRIAVDRVPRSVQSHPRCVFLYAETPAEAVATLGPDRLALFRRVRLYALHRGAALFGDFYQRIADAVLRLIQNHWHNRMTSIHLGRLWLANLIRNLAFLPGWRDVTEIRVDRPIVITGAGETLEGCLPHLRRIRSRTYLMTVDTALPILSASGLTPDLVVAVEAQIWNLADFLGSAGRKTDLAMDLTAHPSTARALGGNVYSFVSRFAELHLFNNPGWARVLPTIFPPLGSVGVVALEMAGRLWKGPILVAGLDFYAAPAKTHARGAPSLLRQVSRDTRLSRQSAGASLTRRSRIEVMDPSGNLTSNDLTLHQYGLRFEALARQLGQVYDLGNHGLKRAVPRISGAEAEALLSSWGGAANKVGDRLKPVRGKRTAVPEVESLLEGLTEVLESAKRTFLNIARADNQAAADATGLLAELDFLDLDFPDRGRRRITEGDYLSRLSASAAWYEERVRQAQVILSRPPIPRRS